MRKMTVKQARKVRDALMIGGTIIVLLAYFWKPFVCVGVIVGLSGLIPHFLYNRCPHCGKQLYRNEGKYCQYCGNNLMTKFKIYRTDKISSETKRHVSVRCYRESRVPDRIIWP